MARPTFRVDADRIGHSNLLEGIRRTGRTRSCFPVEDCTLQACQAQAMPTRNWELPVWGPLRQLRNVITAKRPRPIAKRVARMRARTAALDRGKWPRGLEPQLFRQQPG